MVDLVLAIDWLNPHFWHLCEVFEDVYSLHVTGASQEADPSESVLGALWPDKCSTLKDTCRVH
eukprot:2968400-Amphidinium_carterae.1